MRTFALWIVLFIPQLVVDIFCRLTAPVVCLFVRKEYRLDRVKRLGNESIGFEREYLRGPFVYWQTHDNAADEYFWGLFTETSFFPFIRNATIEQYERSWFIRYVCRLLWVWRNCGYGFSYFVFGRVLDDAEDVRDRGNYVVTVRKSSWQLKGKIPLLGRLYNDVNIGWKAHDGFPRVMYAGRIIGLRWAKD